MPGERGSMLFCFLLLLLGEGLHGVHGSEYSRKENEIEMDLLYVFPFNKTEIENKSGTLCIKKESTEIPDSWTTVCCSSDSKCSGEDTIQMTNRGFKFKKAGQYEVVIEDTDYKVEVLKRICIKVVAVFYSSDSNCSNEDTIQITDRSFEFKKTGQYEVLIEDTENNVEVLMCFKGPILPVILPTPCTGMCCRSDFCFVIGIATGLTMMIAVILIVQFLKTKITRLSICFSKRKEPYTAVTAEQQNDIEQGTDTVLEPI